MASDQSPLIREMIEEEQIQVDDQEDSEPEMTEEVREQFLQELDSLKGKLRDLKDDKMSEANQLII
jgi:hypothetical protein